MNLTPESYADLLSMIRLSRAIEAGGQTRAPPTVTIIALAKTVVLLADELGFAPEAPPPPVRLVQ